MDRAPYKAPEFLNTYWIDFTTVYGATVLDQNPFVFFSLFSRWILLTYTIVYVARDHTDCSINYLYFLDERTNLYGVLDGVYWMAILQDIRVKQSGLMGRHTAACTTVHKLVVASRRWRAFRYI